MSSEFFSVLHCYIVVCSLPNTNINIGKQNIGVFDTGSRRTLWVRPNISRSFEGARTSVRKSRLGFADGTSRWCWARIERSTVGTRPSERTSALVDGFCQHTPASWLGARPATNGWASFKISCGAPNIGQCSSPLSSRRESHLRKMVLGLAAQRGVRIAEFPMVHQYQIVSSGPESSHRLAQHFKHDLGLSEFTINYKYDFYHSTELWLCFWS